MVHLSLGITSLTYFENSKFDMMTDHCAARQQILLRCLTTAIQVAGLEGCYRHIFSLLINYDYLSHFSNCSYN